MEPYQERVIEERRELGERITKLRDFINSPEFMLVPGPEQHRLVQQKSFMLGYATILDERIENFK